jgi:transglycosylase-like protein with SLT domain
MRALTNRKENPMKILILLTVLVIGTCLFAIPFTASAQVTESYQAMTQPQRATFVAEQARRIARQMSGRDYQFTAAFDAEIQKAVDCYARRIGNKRAEQIGIGDARFVFERGQTVAPTLIRIFKAREVSPLMGLYVPLIESEYMNLQSLNAAGAIGMFQFLPATGEHFGLNAEDLLDVEKSADAAARYLAGGLKTFSNDPMKEALALLAYNRGEDKVERDLNAYVNEQNRACSICALTENRDQLDASFRAENVYYVPRFFAAAIVGENPRAFGLQTEPLSSF